MSQAYRDRHRMGFFPYDYAYLTFLTNEQTKYLKLLKELPPPDSGWLDAVNAMWQHQYRSDSD